MKVFYFLFYVFFEMVAKTLPGKPDYSFLDAILGGIVFSVYLSFNILTIVIILGYGKIIEMMIANRGLYVFFLLLTLPFVYVLCIHKKKYLKIQERFNFMNKNLKKRLLAALLGLIYICCTFFLFALSLFIFK